MSNYKIYAFSDEASNELAGQIAALKRNGLAGMEIRGVNGKNVSSLTLAEATEIKKQLDNAGLTVWSIGSPIGKIDIVKDDFKAHLETYKNTLEVAKVLEAENIRMFSFFVPDNFNPDDYRDEVIDRLGQLASLAKPYGIDLCHENEKGIYGALAKECLDIHKALPEIKGVFDPANFVQSGQDTLAAWEILKPYIKYMHIKDAIGEKVVPAGEGQGNIQKIAKEYLSMGGYAFTMEPHLAEFVGLSDLEKEGDKSVVGTSHSYKDNDEAFDAACNAFKSLL
ncbi:MAG: sugar phosphate isomerase/epimerase [Clostridia bacterium]|nr:sugar phosphate isomerase/epimerase [Clostridia bacterium]